MKWCKKKENDSEYCMAWNFDGYFVFIFTNLFVVSQIVVKSYNPQKYFLKQFTNLREINMSKGREFHDFAPKKRQNNQLVLISFK